MTCLVLSTACVTRARSLSYGVDLVRGLDKMRVASG